MRIVARFNSWCSTCRGKIRQGDEIEWEKGIPAQHAVCPEKPERRGPDGKGPQIRRKKSDTGMMEAPAIGDVVRTRGGYVGTIEAVRWNFADVRLHEMRADGTKVLVQRWATMTKVES